MVSFLRYVFPSTEAVTGNNYMTCYIYIKQEYQHRLLKILNLMNHSRYFNSKYYNISLCTLYYMQRQLVAVYGVEHAQHQLDEALNGSNHSPTKLIRNLLSVFFSKDILASSRACGGSKNVAHDCDILVSSVMISTNKIEKGSLCRRSRARRHRCSSQRKFLMR